MPKRKEPSGLGVPALCAELQQLQRRRVVMMKSRIMLTNRITAIVAGTRHVGYDSGMSEAERRAKFEEADRVVEEIAAGGHPDFPLRDCVLIHLQCIKTLADSEHTAAALMRRYAAELPVAAWVEAPEQLGFGLLSLATLVGECGDLTRGANPNVPDSYSGPAKLWRRMQLAPFRSDGKDRMGATWRGGAEGKLSKEEWEVFGYSPRRRSISYLIGESLVKQNSPGGQPGPYRARYDAAKAAAALDPEKARCRPCDGTGKVGAKVCKNCKGKKTALMRPHRHGMILATKLLLKNLWLEWNGHPPMTAEQKRRAAG